MDEFLNSENFKKMAIEYNKKYNSISTLSFHTVDKSIVKSLLINLSKFSYIIDKGFCRNIRFKQIFVLKKEVEAKINEIKKIFNFDDLELNSNKFVTVNYKSLYKIIFNIFNDLFYIEKCERIKEIEDLYECFYSLIDHFIGLL